MYAKTYSAAVVGISAYPIEIETHAENGLPQFVVVGLPDSSVRESKERVHAALKNSGFSPPQKKFTVNLAPADVRKEGSMYDLPIAIGVLLATKEIDEIDLTGTAMLGELAFDGTLRKARGILPIVTMLTKKKYRRIIVPEANADEAAIIGGLEVYPVRTLRDVVDLITGVTTIEPHTVDIDALFRASSASSLIDLSDVKGQESVKRALEVAAAGGHNMIMVGPPGSGKTMLAKRLSTILPPMSIEEALEATTIHSVAGLLPAGQPLITKRPFRAPHHTISDSALIGGGMGFARAGELSLAHHGVLFLDELPEFQRNVLEVLRQPLEDRSITISRAKSSVDFPANVMLVCSMNPCPCGHYGSALRECSCQPLDVSKYMSKISGPLLDRIDLHVDVPAVRVQELAEIEPGAPSSVVRGRVVRARDRQRRRFADRPDLHKNADMQAKDIETYCVTTPEADETLRQALTRLGLSARAFDRILKVARTIADLADSDVITNVHMSEAVQYRNLDRPYWNG